MRIAIIGTGYVGLVSGACFSDFGHHVICVDKDAAKIGALERGIMPIFEPGLDQLVARNVAAGRLAFTTELAAAVADAEAVFIAVGTPSRRGDGHADLSMFTARPARSRVGPRAAIVVTKSTVRSARATRSSASSRRCARRRGRGRLQPRIPARRRGDRGFQASGSNRHRTEDPRAAE